MKFKQSAQDRKRTVLFRKKFRARIQNSGEIYGKYFLQSPCFLQKGVDFMAMRRYNVELYENNENGGAIHAQH